jgi:hypothetical protein
MSPDDLNHALVVHQEPADFGALDAQDPEQSPCATSGATTSFP